MGQGLSTAEAKARLLAVAGLADEAVGDWAARNILPLAGGALAAGVLLAQVRAVRRWAWAGLRGVLAVAMGSVREAASGSAGRRER